MPQAVHHPNDVDLEYLHGMKVLYWYYPKSNLQQDKFLNNLVLKYGKQSHLNAHRLPYILLCPSLRECRTMLQLLLRSTLRLRQKNPIQQSHSQI